MKKSLFILVLVFIFISQTEAKVLDVSYEVSFGMLGKLGISEAIVRMTNPWKPCCTKALTRKRPIFAGEIAKLHS